MDSWFILTFFGLSIGIEKPSGPTSTSLGNGKPWSTSRLPAFKACCAADFSASFGVSLSSPAYSWRSVACAPARLSSDGQPQEEKEPSQTNVTI